MRYLLFCVQCFRRLDWDYFNSALLKGFKIFVAAEQFVQMNIPNKKEWLTVCTELFIISAQLAIFLKTFQKSFGRGALPY